MARSRQLPGAVRFGELGISDLFYMRADKSGGVYKKTSNNACLKPEGGTTKVSDTTQVWKLTAEEVVGLVKWDVPAVEVGAGIPRPEPERRLVAVTRETTLDAVASFIFENHGPEGAVEVVYHLLSIYRERKRVSDGAA